MSLVPSIPLPGLYVPRPSEEKELRTAIRQLYLDWRKEWELKQPPFIIHNIRFTHNPDWQNSFFSITCAREQNHFIWKATSVIFWTAQGALQTGAFLGLILK